MGVVGAMDSLRQHLCHVLKGSESRLLAVHGLRLRKARPLSFWSDVGGISSISYTCGSP
jgi:hypothetical protein